MRRVGKIALTASKLSTTARAILPTLRALAGGRLSTLSLALQLFHERREVVFPEFRPQMSVVTVGLRRLRNDHIFGALDALDAGFERTQGRRVGGIVLEIDGKELGLDLFEMRIGIVIRHGFDAPQHIVGVAALGLFDESLVERVTGFD